MSKYPQSARPALSKITIAVKPFLGIYELMLYMLIVP